MKNIFSKLEMNVNPKPSVIKVNRLVIYIIIAVISVIVGVLAYSVSQPAKINQKKIDTLTSTTVSDDKSTEDLWYKKASNALPARKNSQNSSSPNDSSLSGGYQNFSDNQSFKKRDDLLRSALVSPIKAPDIESKNFNDSDNGDLNKNNFSQNLSENAQNPIKNSEDQDEKQSFLGNLSGHSDNDYLHESLKKPVSPYEIKAGTLIPAVLASGINSDLPGQLTALVSQNVYDSVSGRFLLIPQGSKLILQYDSHVSYGQKRLLVVVKRLILPNGNSLDLDGMPGVDAAGFSGFFDQVDNHYLRIFGSSAMMGLITGGFEVSQPQSANQNTTSSSAEQVMAGSLGQQMGQVAMGMMDKNLNIQPTLIVSPGYVFNVEVTKDLIFGGVYLF